MVLISTKLRDVMGWKTKVYIIFGIFLIQVTWLVNGQELQRDNVLSVQCGQTIESEFASNYQESNFEISLRAGDSLNISISPLGDQLYTAVFVTGPTNLGVATSKGSIVPTAIHDASLEKAPKIDEETLSASGTYVVRVVNFSFGSYYFGSDSYNSLINSGGVGVYTLFIGCTLRDGTVIEPGDTIPAPPAFSGVGFPGLAPVDFSAVAKIPMIANVPMTGAVAPDSNTILGYTLDAAANDTLALSFTRLSGNLNLGLVVLSADNKVVFQASLVTSSELTTTFTLPSAGQYTIGVFRIDLLPPSTPEPTAFQLQATLNP